MDRNKTFQRINSEGRRGNEGDLERESEISRVRWGIKYRRHNEGSVKGPVALQTEIYSTTTTLCARERYEKREKKCKYKSMKYLYRSEYIKYYSVACEDSVVRSCAHTTTGKIKKDLF